MAFDVTEASDAWVRELATSPLLGTRRKLAREIVDSIEPMRFDWLEMLSDDLDPFVARLVADALSQPRDPGLFDADEIAGRFVEGVRPRGFSWEWEYVLGVWVPGHGPADHVVVQRARDDTRARSEAFFTAFAAQATVCCRGAALIKSRRLVCECTRSSQQRGHGGAGRNDRTGSSGSDG